MLRKDLPLIMTQRKQPKLLSCLLDQTTLNSTLVYCSKLNQLKIMKSRVTLRGIFISTQ
jgi:hypothetical protein